MKNMNNKEYVITFTPKEDFGELDEDMLRRYANALQDYIENTDFIELSSLSYYDRPITEISDEELDKKAKKSWFNLCSMASAEHVIRGWDNFINGFRYGYRKAKGE